MKTVTYNSFEFFLFWGVIIVAYQFLVKEYRWILLLIGSIVFYGCAGLSGYLYIGFTICTSYIASRLIERIQSEELRKAVLILTLGLNFGLLLVIKYSSLIPGVQWEFEDRLPLGISFYTFALMGYLMDVYWKTVTAQKNFFKLMLFALFFPAIIVGPINQYGEIAERLYAPKDLEYERCKRALLHFAWGLFKKICVADHIKIYVDLIYGNYHEYSGIMIVSGAVAYAIYIYADFSGCIDMARSVSSFFGIEMVENFYLPYFSKSAAEFWRRWHASLNNWFKSYLFYPILKSNVLVHLNRVLKKKNKKLAKIVTTAIALAVVWITTGLWHGANYTYVLWGIYYAVIMIAAYACEVYEKRILIDGKCRKSCLINALRMSRTFAIVCFGYIIFNAASVSAAFTMIRQMFDVRHFVERSSIWSAGVSFYKNIGGITYLLIMMISIIVLIAHDALEYYGIYAGEQLLGCKKWVKYIWTVLVVFLLLFMMNRTSGDFTYMRF